MNDMGKTASILACALVLLLGCAPTGPQTTEADAGGSPVRGPKILTIADLREPNTFYGFTGTVAGGAGATGGLIHDFLTQADAFGEQHPSLATEVPSVERGTWRVNADNTMDVTWKLKPGVKWHDGSSFTSDDMMFTLALNKDPALFTSDSTVAKRMDSATNPDPYTFIVHWSAVDILAHTPRALHPLPRHLLEDLYRTDKGGAFHNSPFFREQFVGLGPYRITAWEPGAFIETTRFDEYHQGWPRLDKVIVRYIHDQNAMVANIQARAIDVIMPKSVDLDVALDVRRQLQDSGILVRVEPLPRMAQLEPMLRPEYAKPLNGLPNLVVRQALSHAIDRQALTEVATGGLGPIADSWYDPTDPIRRDLEPFIAKYPYDPARAAQLFAEAGWTRGSDGILVHTSGERYDTELWVNAHADESSGAIVVDNWKRVGVNSALSSVPEARADDRGYSAQRPGPWLSRVNTPVQGVQVANRYDGRELATEANRWAGRNRAGYVNPRADALYDLLNSTIDPRARLPLLQEQIKIFTSDVVLLPPYWEPGIMMAGKGIKADIHPGVASYRTDLWDRD